MMSRDLFCELDFVIVACVDRLQQVEICETRRRRMCFRCVATTTKFKKEPRRRNRIRVPYRGMLKNDVESVSLDHISALHFFANVQQLWRA